MNRADLTANQQTAMLADRYTQRADAYQVRITSRLRLQSLTEKDGRACLGRIRRRLSGADDEQYVYRGNVFIATAVKADHPSDIQ